MKLEGKMRSRFPCILLMCVLVFAVSQASEKAAHAGIRQPEEVSLGPKVYNSHIVVVSFLPLPYSFPGSKRPHERVFTNEVYSDRPNDRVITGDFVPKDYLNILNSNLLALAKYHGIRLSIVDNSHAIPADADIVVLGAVEKFAAGKAAEVVLTIQLVDARNGTSLIRKHISRSYSDLSNIPFIPNIPIHTVGRHSIDFQPQRSLLNLAAYESMLDLLQLIGEGVK